MKKILMLLIIFVTGCMKYTDLSDLGIIKKIGITYDGNYTLYAEIYDEIEKDNKPKTEIITSSGESITKLFQEINNNYYKELFLSHIDLLVLDTKLTNKNYQEIIAYFIHNKDLRNDFPCIFSSNISDLFVNSKYDELENFIKTNKIIKLSFDELINDFLNFNTFSLSLINYENKIEFFGNYQYKNTRIEMIK